MTESQRVLIFQEMPIEYARPPYFIVNKNTVILNTGERTRFFLEIGA